jgi:2-dehydro-3-deoxygalactonokinase
MTDTKTALIGIDWGTSNRRAYLLDGAGELLQCHEDAQGILQVVEGDFEGSLRALLRLLRVERADILISGMAGSRNGWQEAPYLATGQPLAALSQALDTVPTRLPGVRCRIVPGYRFVDAHGVPDVMRGEEIQILGALQLNAASGWFLLPGTHSKWVRVEDGCIVEFFTFMTGELYALLSQHGTLAKVMREQATAPEAFAAGLQESRHGSFTHNAFSCRALVVTDMMPAAHSASYLSGLLIGTELFDILRRTPDGPPNPVQVIGSPDLAARYLSAFELLGIRSRVWPPDAAYVAALRLLFKIGS